MGQSLLLKGGSAMLLGLSIGIAKAQNVRQGFEVTTTDTVEFHHRPPTTHPPKTTNGLFCRRWIPRAWRTRPLFPLWMRNSGSLRDLAEGQTNNSSVWHLLDFVPVAITVSFSQREGRPQCRCTYTPDEGG
jgi:hypothetical protein